MRAQFSFNRLFLLPKQTSNHNYRRNLTGYPVRPSEVSKTPWEFRIYTDTVSGQRCGRNRSVWLARLSLQYDRRCTKSVIEILGTHRQASQAEIKKAYRKVRIPVKNPDLGAKLRNASRLPSLVILTKSQRANGPMPISDSRQSVRPMRSCKMIKNDISTIHTAWPGSIPVPVWEIWEMG